MRKAYAVTFTEIFLISTISIAITTASYFLISSALRSQIFQKDSVYVQRILRAAKVTAKVGNVEASCLFFNEPEGVYISLDVDPNFMEKSFAPFRKKRLLEQLSTISFIEDVLPETAEKRSYVVTFLPGGISKTKGWIAMVLKQGDERFIRIDGKSRMTLEKEIPPPKPIQGEL